MQSESGSPEPQDDLGEKLAEAEATVGAIYDQPLEPLEERALRRPRAVSLAEFKAAVMEVMGGAEFNPEPQTEDHRRQWRQHMIGRTPVVPMPVLSIEELDRIADGEPYCFRCGKPASSFPEYIQAPAYPESAAFYVRQEEGTYNPETNRFACDGCYIAIGMPVGPLGVGWKAP